MVPVAEQVPQLLRDKQAGHCAVLWIWNDLFRYRIQLCIFRVLDSDPPLVIEAYGTVFGNDILVFKKAHLKFTYKEESTNYLPFSFSQYTPTVMVQNSQT